MASDTMNEYYMNIIEILVIEWCGLQTRKHEIEKSADIQHGSKLAKIQ